VVEAALEGQPDFKLVDMKVELEQLRKSGELASERDRDALPSLLAGPYLRTIPGMHPCDGFFAAMIERTY
jgi:16S rRNA (cytosine967-C5)-methyltransferase